MFSMPSAINDVPLNKISISDLHFERNHSDEGLDDLVASLNDVGLIHPITVRKKGKVFELLAGKRRLDALKEAGARSVRCTIVKCDDYKAELLSIQENTSGTEPMSPQEQKKAVDRIVELTQQQIGKRQDTPDESRVSKKPHKGFKAGEDKGREVAAKTLNMSRTKIDRLRNLDKLTASARRAFENAQITVVQAEMLTRMSNKEQHDKLPKMIRETQAESRHREGLEKASGKDPDLKLAVKLFEKLKVRCKETIDISDTLRGMLTAELVQEMESQGYDVIEACEKSLNTLLGDTSTAAEWAGRSSD